MTVSYRTAVYRHELHQVYQLVTRGGMHSADRIMWETVYRALRKPVITRCHASAEASALWTSGRVSLKKPCSVPW